MSTPDDTCTLEEAARERFIRRLIGLGFSAGQIRAILARQDELLRVLHEECTTRETGERG